MTGRLWQHGSMNLPSHARLLVLLVGLAASGVLGIIGCDAVPGGCRSDADCNGSAAICDVSAAVCVACLASSDCEEGAACCQGDCRTGTVEELSGCDAATTGDGPTACADQVCIVGEARAAIATVGDGVCACPCDPASGGTVCTVDDSAAGFTCGCDRTDPVGTCEAAAIDAAGIPHRPADSCSPDNTCFCFATTTVCTGSADCTGAGCVDLVNDAASCGVAGRACTDDATGIAADARCLSGGCACNAASDCTGAGLNVDSCAFVNDEASQCVCDNYTSAGAPAACPMGLACEVGGCVFEGQAYADRDALVAAVAAR